ncbi:hypothetical protein RRG08_054784 [Elysia crispata]|uniref:G-protein coupled receptors family 1 profile domain-containing protein n=1 Tax=Elysia crispata TaxID=231223 RepID=A0AAE1ABU8_9GAST|nr:hypothetical protein RRG08_054784 [Elysia crispata]
MDQNENHHGAMNVSADTATAKLFPLLGYAQLITICMYVFSITIPICVFGMLTNIANVLVFYKMGISTPSNISLFCLAIADFFTLCFILIISLGNNPLFLNADLVMSMRDIARMVASVYYGFSALGSWITAVINVERSCCVAFPMKVCGLNKLVLVDVESAQSGFGKCGLNNLVLQIKSSRRLRDSMTKPGKSSSDISEKDIKLVRSMIFVCCIYIIGSAAGVVIYIVSTAHPTLEGDNPYLGTLITAFIVHANLFQAVSCSVNILVYFRMGSKFKKTFFQLFFCRSK